MSPSGSKATRRAFLQQSSAAMVGGSLAATLAGGQFAHAAGNDTLKIALVGCGGRGTGAAVNALNADENVRLTVMADAFADQLNKSRQALAAQFPNSDKLAVNDDQAFVGFDAYQKVMQTDVDVVLLCTPPHFRPAHLQAAIDAGKHVFCEKPVAVDPAGVRQVLKTAQQAQEKNLSIVSGLCWRYDYGVRETMKRIQDGAIGELLTVQENYLTGTLWHRGREPQWSEMEYQMRNWLYFTWLSGDHIVEQHVHSLDKAMWLMGDKPPLHCVGLGGREVRKEEMWGNIFDHFAICYEWENGAKVFAFTRQMKGCEGDVEDYVVGTRGRAKLLRHEIEAEEKWRYRGPKPSMYDVEHKELFAGLRSGNIINNGLYMSYSTLLAIMGREACYTGQKITWDQAINSPQDLSPKAYEWGEVPVPAVAVPGVTTFA
ncbi:MAG: Gfo/Idh/MocA family oxidoreductase [Pirellulaceae bacterium]|nr:Gfo/Idh/MocA family oxidoreductase [Pirellulaceae bacterium]